MKYFPETNIIETPRLVLRPFTRDDAEEVALICNNENIYNRTLHIPYPYSENDAIEWISHHAENFANDKDYVYAITCKNTGEIFGSIGIINDKDHKRGELGYWLGEQFWGNGYATEACKAILEFVFTIKDLHKVIANHYIFNPASGNVMKKCGMKKEGLRKQHVYKDGTFIDIVDYGILRDEFKKRRVRYLMNLYLG